MRTLPEGDRCSSSIAEGRDLASAAVAVRRRPELLAAGVTDDVIRVRLQRGTLSTLRPGLYLPSKVDRSISAQARHRLLIQDVISDVADSSVVSHVSAAVLLGLPLWNVRLGRVHVTRQDYRGAHRSQWLHVHDGGANVPFNESSGFVVTSPARTVVDCARLLAFEQGVVLADAALARSLVSKRDLEIEVAEAQGRTGVPRARRVVSFADSRSESPGESRSRVLFARMGLPKMALQYEIYEDDGLLVARTDFAIPELKIAGEFDGKVKYGRLLKPGQSAGDAVFEEKQREDSVRDLRWGMVRWVWTDLATPTVIKARWDRAIARAVG